MLRVLDAQAPIAVAVRAHDVAEEIQHRRDPGVADRVHAQLQAGVIGGHQTRSHVGQRLHLVREQAARRRRIGVRLKEIGRRRSERSVRVALHRADPQPRRPEGAMDAELRLVVPAGLHRRRIDAHRQLAAACQIGVDVDVLVRRVHVLHAGDAERRRVLQCALDRTRPLRFGHLRDDALDVGHCRVLEHAGRQSLRVADDLAAGRIGRPLGHAGAAERCRIGQRHVAVVAVHEHRRAASPVVDERAGRQRGRRPPLVVPVAAEHPFAWLGAGPRDDATGELGGRVGVFQIDVLELRATVDQVHVRVVEARHHAPAFSVDDGRIRTTPTFNCAGVADVDDALADRGQRLGVRLPRITGPDVGVEDDEIGADPRRPRARERDRAGDRAQGDDEAWTWRFQI